MITGGAHSLDGMKTRIVEATNTFNWGKFLLGQFDREWKIRSVMPDAGDRPLLRQVGMAHDQLLVLDLQTCEGALFSVRSSGLASADLAKHQIWVCPLFEPFLTWLYTQDVGDLDALPGIVELEGAPAAMAGYRRSGVVGDYLTEKLKQDLELLADDPHGVGDQKEIQQRWWQLRVLAMTVGLDPFGHLQERATEFELQRLWDLLYPAGDMA